MSSASKTEKLYKTMLNAVEGIDLCDGDNRDLANTLTEMWGNDFIIHPYLNSTKKGKCAGCGAAEVTLLRSQGFWCCFKCMGVSANLGFLPPERIREWDVPAAIHTLREALKPKAKVKKDYDSSGVNESNTRLMQEAQERKRLHRLDVLRPKTQAMVDYARSIDAWEAESFRQICPDDMLEYCDADSKLMFMFCNDVRSGETIERLRLMACSYNNHHDAPHYFTENPDEDWRETRACNGELDLGEVMKHFGPFSALGLRLMRNGNAATRKKMATWRALMVELVHLRYEPFVKHGVIVPEIE
jgi:hypothetical protein